MDIPSTSSSSNDAEENLCCICASKIPEKLVNVGVKGKETLQKVSVERCDNLFAELDFSKAIFVHGTCRSNYINKISIEAAKKRALAGTSSNISPVKRKLRRSSSTSTDNLSDTFNWEENCIICAHEANIGKQKKLNVKRRKSICLIETDDFVRNIVKMLTPFTDDYNREILKRINSAPDLITAKAKYHKECYTKLINDYAEKMKEPKTKYTDKIEQAMEEIYAI